MPVLQESNMLLPRQTEKVRMDSRKEEETRRTNMVNKKKLYFKTRFRHQQNFTKNVDQFLVFEIIELTTRENEVVSRLQN